jgi:hypothetical protein
MDVANADIAGANSVQAVVFFKGDTKQLREGFKLIWGRSRFALF